ncbi:MAG: transcription termination factor Rho, partial [Oceanospirillaceae bacterium]|nr:transcription termination factor Rho [Oceanospirillaceae bacterium]
IRRSGTRREDMLMGEAELQRLWVLRKVLSEMEDVQAIEFLLDRLRTTKTNDEFFLSMKNGG